MRIDEVVSRTPDKDLPRLTDIRTVGDDGVSVEALCEGKWVKGRYGYNIRIDQPTYGRGQVHAHVMDRNGVQLVVVNIDGTASHGTRGVLSAQDADGLRAKDFKIRPDNIVEYEIYGGEEPKLLFEEA